MTAKTNTEPAYALLRLWGEMMGSRAAYITEQVTLAQKENAPADAVYADHNSDGRIPGAWVRVTDVTAPMTLLWLRRSAENHGWQTTEQAIRACETALGF